MKRLLGSILRALALIALGLLQSTKKSLVSGAVEKQPGLPDGGEND
jgi:hypothetical protein